LRLIFYLKNSITKIDNSNIISNGAILIKLKGSNQIPHIMAAV
jgi:hypothetical protein